MNELSERVDKASRVIHAPPDEIYRAFSTEDALKAWLPPDGMEGEISAFDFREGGGYRMRLVYASAEDTPGKTSEDADEVTVRFVTLLPSRRIEQVVTFASDREEFAGAMRMAWVFEGLATGTRVEVSCTNVPRGIRPEDHAVGLNAALGNLAALVEERH